MAGFFFLYTNANKIIAFEQLDPVLFYSSIKNLYCITVKILNVGTDIAEQTGLTQIRLLFTVIILGVPIFRIFTVCQLFQTNHADQMPHLFFFI